LADCIAAILVAVFFVLAPLSQTVSAAPAPVPRTPRAGINLNGPCDWNTELPFVDLTRFSRRWSGQRSGEAFGAGAELELDASGNVKSLPPEAWAESPLLTFEGHPWPSGTYSVFHEGRGKLSFGKAESGPREAIPGGFRVALDSRRGNLHLSLLETDPSDPVRDIRVILPGFENTWRDNPWNPTFLERWRGITCIRFMDFMATNNSDIRTWSERPKPGDATFAGRGVPVEWMVDLCNRLRADAWFCIPHAAGDDYVRRFAEAVRDGLRPGLRAYVEYSNEVWNPMFRQNAYAADKGKELGLAGTPWEAGWRYTALRSVEIFRIFEDVFGGRDRLVRVLPLQSGNAHMAVEILGFRDAWKSADALALAPYLSMNVPPTPSRYLPLELEKVKSGGLDGVFRHLGEAALPESERAIREARELADRFGLDLLAYEGGQHLTGVQGAENDLVLTDLFRSANADARMGEIYSRMFRAWEGAGGSLFCHFSSVGRWTKWGSWGLVEYHDSPDTPKMRAFRTWAKSRSILSGGD